MSSTVEQIKERLSIDDVVGSYLKLERAGKSLKANCPFHREKTPSFFVSPDRGSYYCFGCGAKGDIFSFVEEFEGLDFRGALKLLADRAGVELTAPDERVESEKDRLFKIHEYAVSFFQKALGGEAENYLHERGLSQATIEAFKLGYVPEEWRLLYDHLSAKGFTDVELVRAGLVKKSEKGATYYDTFRGRIMFPIADASGRTLAFSGRVFPPLREGDEVIGDRGAKYVNSPETPIFHKSHILYAYDKSKGAIRKYDFCIVVEGQLDVLMSHQAGFTNTVAPLGTSLSEVHLERLQRLSTNLVLALDADSAGIASASKSAAQALAMGFDVKVAKLPLGMDPADAIKKDEELWRTAIREARHIIEFLLDVITETIDDERKRELEIKRQVLPYIRHIDNKIDQAHFIKIVASHLNVPEDAVREEVAKLPAAEAKREVTTVSNTTTNRDRKDIILEKVLALLVWQGEIENPSIDVSAMQQKICDLMHTQTFEKLIAPYDTNELLFQAEATFSGITSLDEVLQELLLALEGEQLRTEFIRLMKELREAEQAHDTERADSLLKECHTLSSKIEKTKHMLTSFN